jgi:hypothetical protein
MDSVSAEPPAVSLIETAGGVGMSARIRFLFLVTSWIAAGSVATAQSSVSYKLQASVFNAGGDPSGGSVLASTSFHIRLDSIGEGLVQVALGSASFHMDGGFVEAYRPPGEVAGLRYLANKRTLEWDPEISTGVYAVYRNTLNSLPGSFGVCLPPSVSGTSADDAALPSVGAGFFYLVTARNRLGEEGTKGQQSNGAARPNPAPCS